MHDIHYKQNNLIVLNIDNEIIGVPGLVIAKVRIIKNIFGRVVCPNFGHTDLTFKIYILEVKNSFATIVNGLCFEMVSAFK